MKYATLNGSFEKLYLLGIEVVRTVRKSGSGERDSSRVHFLQKRRMQLDEFLPDSRTFCASNEPGSRAGADIRRMPLYYDKIKTKTAPEYRKKGKADCEDVSAAKFLRGVDTMPVQEIEELKNHFVNQLLPVKIYLFGSFANNTYTAESDFDFYIVVKDGKTDMPEKQFNMQERFCNGQKVL